MAFHRTNAILRNGTGLAVAGALVTVYVNGTDDDGDYTDATKAALFANPDLTGSITNPTTTDNSGEYRYFIANGTYDEVATYGTVTETETFIQMIDLDDNAFSDLLDDTIAAKDEAVAAAASANSAKTLAQTAAAEAATSSAAADESATTAAAARGDAIAASTASQTSANDAADNASAALDAKTAAESAAASVGGTPGLVKTATYTETAMSGDVCIFVNATAGAVTVNLPTAVANATKFNVKKTDATANAVTVDPNGAQTIEGAATFVLTDEGDSITFKSDNSNWWVI